MHMSARKVLVTYATKYGTTREIAEVIAGVLTRAGFDTDVIPVMEVGIIDAYDAIVIGSPLYMGKILVEAREFCEQYKPYLEGKWIAFFVSGIAVCKEENNNKKTMLDAIDAMSEYVKIDEKGTFGGRLSLNILSESDMQLATIAGASEGDFLNMEDVRAWAKEIGRKIADL
jgi:menaquinone-dependent protoporphyrinogen oxidase